MTIYTIQAHIIYVSCKLYLYIENKYEYVLLKNNWK